tara:strand:- start:373 stop:552 length:180 start_codon:yes stop_codon:yes gene_type:complete
MAQPKRLPIMSREPSKILDNLNQDYVDELAKAKTQNPNVNTVLFCAMVLLDKEPKTTVA